MHIIWFIGARKYNCIGVMQFILSVCQLADVLAYYFPIEFVWYDWRECNFIYGSIKVRLKIGIWVDVIILVYLVWLTKMELYRVDAICFYDLAIAYELTYVMWWRFLHWLVAIYLRFKALSLKFCKGSIEESHFISW